MQLALPQSPATHSQLLVFAPQLQASMRRLKLKIVWHKEWDGKRDRIVAQWMIDQ